MEYAREISGKKKETVPNTVNDNFVCSIHICIRHIRWISSFILLRKHGPKAARITSNKQHTHTKPTKSADVRALSIDSLRCEH